MIIEHIKLQRLKMRCQDIYRLMHPIVTNTSIVNKVQRSKTFVTVVYTVWVEKEVMFLPHNNSDLKEKRIVD